jgi:GNAT superfamily N-acetyltransferase
MTAREEDIYDAFEIGTASTVEHFEEFKAVSDAVDWPETTEEFELEAEHWCLWYLREKSSGKVVAKVSIADLSRFIGIGGACTHPEYQRQGLSAHLINAAIKKEEHYGKERPFALCSSPAGVKLYENLGFIRVGRSTRFKLDPNHTIDKVDLEAVANDLGISFRLVDDLDRDLPQMAGLAHLATKASYQDYYKTFLASRRGQEHRKPIVFIIERDGKTIAFGGMIHIMGLLIIGPIISPDAAIAQILIQLLIDDRDTRLPERPILFSVFETVLPKDSDWISRLKSIGLLSSSQEPFFQYTCQGAQFSSIFESYSQGKVIEFVMHNEVVM